MTDDGRLDDRARDLVLSRLLDGIYVYDLVERRNVFVNARYQEITGYSPAMLDDLRGSAFLELFHAQERDAVLAHMQQVMSSSDGEVFEVEYRFRIADGTWMWCSSRDCILARLPDGSAHRMIGYFTDISARKHAEEEVARDRQRKDEFLAILAHELRNPLAPIRSGVDVLLRGLESGTRVETLRMMQRQIAYLVRLVDDLLDVSRVTRGKIALHLDAVDLREVVHTAVGESALRGTDPRPAVQVELPDEPLLVEADRVRLEQVLFNLLDNARKFTPAGRPIRVRAVGERGVVRIVVRDEGIGIGADEIDAIFKVFHQAAERAGGLGVGLSLARSLVEMHGGSLVARSDGLHRGSEFVVTLPWRTPGTTATDVSRAAEPCLAGTRVLVVDDNRDAATSLAMLLDTLGATARTAFDGPSALATVEEFEPHAMVLDIGMPGMDGYEVARTVRERHARDGLLLIALTGWGQPRDRDRARAAGFDVHLTKPVQAEQLRRAVVQPSAQ